MIDRPRGVHPGNGAQRNQTRFFRLQPPTTLRIIDRKTGKLKRWRWASPEELDGNAML
jgi:hypothetical protein